MKKTFGWILIVALAAVLGGLVGELIASLLAPGKLRDLCAAGWNVGFAPAALDMKTLVLTFGARIKLTLFSALGAILGGFLYYKFS